MPSTVEKERAQPRLRPFESQQISGIRLFRELVLAQLLQAITQAALEHRRRIRVEGNEIPERLAAVPAEPGQGRCVRIRMTCHILTNCPVRMLRQLVQRLGVRSRMRANEPQQVEI